MELAKQDRNGVRTATDIERRYRLGQIDKTKKEVEEIKKERVVDTALSSTSTNPVQNKIITEALNGKVGTENGKGLSTNDFTNKDKESIHTHDNKKALDLINEIKIQQWDENLTKQFYLVGDIYNTTTEGDPNSILGYGEWIKIDEQQTGDYTIYNWLRTM